ncbi:MAG TPA: response regulator [Longimicrobiales bacterium]|nr:response regulator [Longimicrobiales bacterium]
MSTVPTSSVRVLFVEDAVDQAHLVKTFLSHSPAYVVTHVQDGQAALRLIRDREWDLLVTDLNLPGADGFAVTKAFRAKYPRGPILVTTGYTQAEYEEQALRSGADYVMIKPLHADDFRSRVEAVLAASRAPEEAPPSLVLVVEGRLGDAEMGCGGTLIGAVARGHAAVVVPVFDTEDAVSREEFKAASVAADILGVELRVDRTLFGDSEGQRDLLERTLNELRPGTVYMPSLDDRDSSRRAAALLARDVSQEVETVLAYETATTGLDFAPSRFQDIRAEMVLKLEALAAYQAVGAPRVDLRPRMAQAYARYWGRFQDFTEVEAFESVPNGGSGRTAR